MFSQNLCISLHDVEMFNKSYMNHWKIFGRIFDIWVLHPEHCLRYAPFPPCSFETRSHSWWWQSPAWGSPPLARSSDGRVCRSCSVTLARSAREPGRRGHTPNWQLGSFHLSPSEMKYFFSRYFCLQLFILVYSFVVIKGCFEIKLELFRQLDIVHFSCFPIQK